MKYADWLIKTKGEIKPEAGDIVKTPCDSDISGYYTIRLDVMDVRIILKNGIDKYDHLIVDEPKK